MNYALAYLAVTVFQCVLFALAYWTLEAYGVSPAAAAGVAVVFALGGPRYA